MALCSHFLTWKSGLYTVPSSRKKGTKRCKTAKLRKERLLILEFCKNPFWSQSPAKEDDFTSTREAQGAAAASVSTLAESRAVEQSQITSECSGAVGNGRRGLQTGSSVPWEMIHTVSGC